MLYVLRRMLLWTPTYNVYKSNVLLFTGSISYRKEPVIDTNIFWIWNIEVKNWLRYGGTCIYIKTCLLN